MPRSASWRSLATGEVSMGSSLCLSRRLHQRLGRYSPSPGAYVTSRVRFLEPASASNRGLLRAQDELSDVVEREARLSKPLEYQATFEFGSCAQSVSCTLEPMRSELEGERRTIQRTRVGHERRIVGVCGSVTRLVDSVDAAVGAKATPEDPFWGTTETEQESAV